MAMNMPSPASTPNTPTGRSVNHPRDRRKLGPRWFDLALGIWLVISAFLWPHSAASQLNTWVVGALVTLVALLAMLVPTIRFVNAILAGWLFASTFAIPHVVYLTMWHNAVLAIVVIIASLTGGGTASPLRWRHRRVPA